MSESRTLSERYAKLALALIENDPMLAHIAESKATICYLSSDYAKRSKGRAVKGECEKVADKNKWAIPCDFTITIYEPNCEGMSDELVSRVLFHELLHVGIDVDEDGCEKYSIRPHDLEDFREVLARWGIDWSEVE